VKLVPLQILEQWKSWSSGLWRRECCGRIPTFRKIFILKR